MKREKETRKKHLRETRKQRERGGILAVKAYRENFTWDERESQIEDNFNEKVREKETWKKMAVDRKGKISKGQEERAREGGVDAELYRSLLSSVRDVTDVPLQRR